MTKRVDKVEGHLMSIRSSQKMEAYQVADYRSKELKKEILKEVDQKMTTLETPVTHWMDEDYQAAAIQLQEISGLVMIVKAGQQKMWGAIERISRDLQELIHKDVSTDGEGDEDPMLATTNLDALNRLMLEQSRWAPLGLGWGGYPKRRNPV